MPHSERAPKPRSLSPEQEQELQIDRLLGTLPLELRGKWEEEHAELPADELLSELQAFMDKRAEARLVKNLREQPKHVKMEESYPLAIANLVERVEREEHTFLGKGKAGRVVASIRNPEVCYKVMFPLDQIPPGTNAIAIEADIQTDLSTLGEVTGVRVPQVFAYVEHGDVRAIMMERLDAVSIRDLLHFQEAWPAPFKVETFFPALEKFIERMHDLGYHHRDLHDGNVLVDRQTGEPRIVDFGLSKRIIGSDEPYRYQYIRSGHVIEDVLPSDAGGIQNIKLLVQKAFVKGVQHGT